MKNILCLIVLLYTFNSNAADVSALWRSYTNSCGYYTSQDVDVQLIYNDIYLPGDADVKLIYAVGNPDQFRDWEMRQVVDTSKISLSNSRTVNITVKISQRGSPVLYNRLQFVWEIHLSSGSVYYVNGSHTSWGFFEANIWPSLFSHCYSAETPKEPMSELKIYNVDRY